MGQNVDYDELVAVDYSFFDSLKVHLLMMVVRYNLMTVAVVVVVDDDDDVDCENFVDFENLVVRIHLSDGVDVDAVDYDYDYGDFDSDCYRYKPYLASYNFGRHYLNYYH